MIFWSAIIVPILVSCGRGPLIAGGGSGTGAGNGIVTGTVIYPDSGPVVGAVVRLRTQKYLADTSGATPSMRSDTMCDAKTDSLGKFRMDSVDTGRYYSIEVNDCRQNAMATLYRKSVSAIDEAGPRFVLPVAKIDGTVKASGFPGNAYVLIYGLERMCRADSIGRFEISDLPVGKCEEGECEYRIRILVPAAGGGYTVRESELEVTAGGKATIDD
jgi:hypothetical protein